jgi:2-C-methyl-D-erythritol 4-phosphate cytidylyltransferase
MKKYAVIVAGGSGLRMNSNLPKQFMLLNGKTVLWHTLTAFLAAFDDVKIILVLSAQYIETGQSIIKTLAGSNRITITAGGQTRYQSVKNGLKLVEKDAVIFVHDGVRCLVTPNLIQRCYEMAVEKGNAVPATTPVDTLRIESGNKNEIIDRNKVRIIQTPQTFLGDVLIKAFEQQYDASFTDEAIVVENLGVKINLIEGEAANIKITSPVDLLLAGKLLEQRTKSN